MENQKYSLYMCVNTVYICVEKYLREILIWTNDLITFMMD